MPIMHPQPRWNLHFAWWPVKLGALPWRKGARIWLKWVQRRRVWFYEGDRRWKEWEYRLVQHT